jgi:hypothetical protein
MLHIVRQAQPGVLTLLVNRHLRLREPGIGKGADRHGDDPGTPSASQHTVAPQSPQKRNRATLPLSPACAYSLLGPSIVTASDGNRACAANTLPVRFWQARQWQMETRTGSPRVWTTRFPQRQVALRVVMNFASSVVPLVRLGE